MIAATIGRKFLAHYNQERGTNLSPKEFFETVYFPLFYGHPKYMQWAVNSPFVQMKKGQKPHLLTKVERIEKLEALSYKIAEGEIDASTAIGYPASESEKFATTSGQVTNLALPADEDTAYASWIGSGMGIGIGGITVLFDNILIMTTLFEGWHHYRDDLNDLAYMDIPGNKINGWNAHWLTHALSNNFHAEDPRFEFPPPFEAGKEGDSMVVKRLHWLKILLAISKKLPEGKLTGYFYHYDKTNKTFGFIPIDLPQVRRPSDLYIKIFGNYAYQRDSAQVETLYGSAQPFQRICEMGAIGVASLEPKGLRDLIYSGWGDVKTFKYDTRNIDNQLTFNAYITWLLAMLNNDEFWDEAGRVANLLLQYETATKRKTDLSTVRINQVEDILNATSKRQFMNALIPIMQSADINILTDLEVLAEIIHKLPNDNFPYFHALTKLRYAKQSREGVSSNDRSDLSLNN